jgi:rSAM/selenodomain-associated transferase 2
MRLSIIIPAIDEEENIGKLIKHLLQYADSRLVEIIVADGGSRDHTVSKAQDAGATVLSTPKGRSTQMNHGAKLAKGDVLYFIHADSIPPSSYLDDIQDALSEGYGLGCYRYVFDSPKFMLKINGYFTRFDRIMCRGGDQTLFIKREIFEYLGGYKEDFIVMEDYDIIIRARKKERFKIIPKNAIVSARKYDHNSWLRVNFANLTVFMMYFMGYHPVVLLRTYRKLLRHPKEKSLQ